MAFPNITLDVEPMQDQVVRFQLLAPAAKGLAALGQVSLLLKIRNMESQRLVLTNVGVRLLFSDNAEPQAISFPVNLAIEPNLSVLWHNKVFVATRQETGLDADTFINQNIFTKPNANIVQVILHFRDFADPFKALFALGLHESPTPKKAYQFPARKQDLLEGEVWCGAGGVHGQSGDGNQLFALDLGVRAWNGNHWTEFFPGTSSIPGNTDFRIWKKPVYAMADGKVLDYRWNFFENPRPCAPDQLEPHVVRLINELGDGSGNFVRLLSGDETHTYAHFMWGSVPQGVRRRGALVKRGDLLGLVGNSGSSSAPHLHLGVLKYRKLVPHSDAKDVLRPLPFVDMHSIRSDKAKGIRKSDPWFKHSRGHGLCMPAGQAKCLIWPSSILP